MVNLKYKSKPFGQMTDKELNVSAYALLTKLQVITGWNIPDEPLDDILIEQLRLKFKESFPLVNPDEMEFAFRSNTQVKDWGKAMNLSLIDEVMIPYLEKRSELSKLEEQQQPKQIEHKEDLSDKAMDDWAEELKMKVKAGKIAVEFLPIMVYDHLVKKGKIATTKEGKHEYLARAVGYRQSKLAEEANEKMTRETQLAVERFNEMKILGVFEGEEIDRLKALAKRMILWDYLKNE